MWMARVSAEQWLRQIYRKDQKESEELFRLFSCREQEYTKERTSENASVSGAIFLILEMYSPFEGRCRYPALHCATPFTPRLLAKILWDFAYLCWAKLESIGQELTDYLERLDRCDAQGSLNQVPPGQNV